MKIEFRARAKNYVRPNLKRMKTNLLETQEQATFNK